MAGFFGSIDLTPPTNRAELLLWIEALENALKQGRQLAQAQGWLPTSETTTSDGTSTFGFLYNKRFGG